MSRGTRGPLKRAAYDNGNPPEPPAAPAAPALACRADTPPVRHRGHNREQPESLVQSGRSLVPCAARVIKRVAAHDQHDGAAGQPNSRDTVRGGGAARVDMACTDPAKKKDSRHGGES